MPAAWRRIPFLARIGIWFAIMLGLTLAAAIVLLNTKSDDEAKASRFQPIHTFSTQDFHALAFSPTDENTAFFGHHGGVQMSADGGNTWESLVDQPGWDAMNLVFDPFAPNTLYAAGHDIFYRSDDGGTTWEAVSTDLPGFDLHAFAASPTQKGKLYAFAVGYGVFVSENGGASWQPLWPEAPQGTFGLLALEDGALLLAGGADGLFRSEDGGATWVASGEGINADASITVRGSPDGSRLYAGTTDGLFASTDAGVTWTLTSLDDTAALAIGVNPNDGMELMVVNSRGDLFHSLDGGATWQN